MTAPRPPSKDVEVAPTAEQQSYADEWVCLNGAPTSDELATILAERERAAAEAAVGRVVEWMRYDEQFGATRSAMASEIARRDWSKT